MRSRRGAMIAGVALAGLAAVLWSDSGRADRATPAQIVDLDGDGVRDTDDRCVERPGLEPDGCPPRDSDGDGVLDRQDRCSDAPGPVGNDGCPDPDGDRDGVVDRHDRCRALHGHPDFAGCPAPDRDGDGITDRDDRCVTRAETWNGKRDDDGCPDRGDRLITVSRGTIEFTSRRLFRRSGTLSRRGRSVVTLAASALRAARARSVQVVIPGDPGKAAKRAAAIVTELGRSLTGVAITTAPASADGSGSSAVQLVFR